MGIVADIVADLIQMHFEYEDYEEFESWILTVYDTKLRLCLKRRTQRMAAMTVWARVKTRRDDFTPLLSLCCEKYIHFTQDALIIAQFIHAQCHYLCFCCIQAK